MEKPGATGCRQHPLLVVADDTVASVAGFWAQLRHIARRIASMVPPQTCVLTDGLSQAQIAGLQYHGNLTLQRSTKGPAHTCQTLVVAPNSQVTLGQRVDLAQWTFKATVRRLSDTKESLLVYQRVSQ